MQKKGVSYKTAWRWYKAGQLDAYQTSTGTVIVRDPQEEKAVAGSFSHTDANDYLLGMGRCHVEQYA